MASRPKSIRKASRCGAESGAQEEAPKQQKNYDSYGPDPIKALWLKYRPRTDEIGKKFEALRKEAKASP